MTFKSGLKLNLNSKLAMSFFLSIFFACSQVMANNEFPFINIAQLPSEMKQTQVRLDTASIKEITPKTQTVIPYNLRGSFNEADYFSSEIDENIELKNTTKEVPQKSFEEILKTESSYQSPEEFYAQRKNFTPKENANTFFAPTTAPNITVEEKETIEPKTLVDNENKIEQSEPENTLYTASIDTGTDVYTDELEGLSINKIHFIGLNKISAELIKKNISTEEFALYNTNLIQQDLQKIYALGYFSDNMAAEPVLNPDKTIDLTFILEESILVNNIEIQGNNVVSLAELIPFIKPIQGYPQNLKEINKSVDNIHNYYKEKGYVLAGVSSIDDDTEGNLVFTINEGIINQINIRGNEHTKDYIIKRNIMTQAGTVYNEEYLKKDLAKIYSTQIFDEVTREITPNETNEGTYDVTVVVKEKSTNSIALGGGIDTGLGAFGSISLREDNFLGKAQQVSLTGILGSGILLSDASIKNHMNYQVELGFFEPHFINSDNSLMSKLYYREMGSWNVPLAIERRIGLKGGVEHKVKGFDHLTTNFTIGAEHIRLKEGDLNRISQLYAANNLNLALREKQLADGFFLNLSPGIRYSNLDDEEVPRQGIMAQAQFIESVGVTDFNHTNGRLSGAVTKFIPVFKKSSVSLTAKAGVKVHGDDMPEIMAYRLGGPYSIRGYRMSGVGTGESFLMGSAELATPLPFVDRLKWDIFKKMRLTFFIDTGKVFDPTITNVLYDRPLHAITAGIGLRLFIPGIGPMSVDYGIPITNPGRYGSENGYFTFGTGGLNTYNY